jgi:hypothetical protein
MRQTLTSFVFQSFYFPPVPWPGMLHKMIGDFSQYFKATFSLCTIIAFFSCVTVWHLIVTRIISSNRAAIIVQLQGIRTNMSYFITSGKDCSEHTSHSLDKQNKINEEQRIQGGGSNKNSSLLPFLKIIPHFPTFPQFFFGKCNLFSHL